MSSERGQLYSGLAEIAAGAGGHIANIVGATNAAEHLPVLPAEITRIMQPLVEVGIHPIVGLVALSLVYTAIVIDGTRRVINSANVHSQTPNLK